MTVIVYVNEDPGNRGNEEQFAVLDYENEYERKDLLKNTLEEIVDEYSTNDCFSIRIESLD